MKRTKPRDKTVPDESQQDIRDQLVSMGLRPREADARVSIAQTHLADFGRRGGLA